MDGAHTETAHGHANVADAVRASGAIGIAGVAVLTAAYPWFLDAALSIARANGGTPAVVVAIAAALGVAAAAGVIALAITIFRTASTLWERGLCMIAVATPTLYVGTMNYTYLFDIRPALPAIWVGVWAVLGVGAIALSRRPAGAKAALPSRKLAVVHGISAGSILVLFLAPHVANHIVGFWSGPAHIAVMQTVRLLYRNTVIEPLMLALVAFQIVTGLILVAPRLRLRTPVLSMLQAMSGLYIGIFFLGHIVPVFEARAEGADTNWNWLTANDAGLMANLNRIYLAPHYWVGVIALSVHLACGLRDVMLKHGVAGATAERRAFAGIGVGLLASTLILLGLLGVHLA